MDDNENYTPEDLEKCSYRYLQQVAKTMKLPANVKKIHLIKMIHAKKYRSATDFENIVQNVCHERKIVSQMRKIVYKKPTKIQGREVTSTSLYSPPGVGSPKRTGHIVIRCPENSRRSLKSIPMQTDRVLRSTGREPGKYRFLNTVIGVIKSQNKPANRRFVDKRPKFVINKFKTNILNCNKSMLKINEDKTQLQIFAKNPGPITSTPLPSKRLRTISGLFPQNPSLIEHQLPFPKTINFRRQDGNLSRINLSPPNFNTSFENFVDKTQSQVTVSVQDIINSNIEEQVFSDTNMTEYMMTDSEQHKNNDYPNMSKVTETTTFINQPTIVLENPVFNQVRCNNLNENINKIRNLLKERQSLRIEISKPETPTYSGGEELKNLLLMKQPECLTNNQQKTCQNEPTYVVNQSKYPKLQFNIPQSNCSTPILNCNITQLNCNLNKLNNNLNPLNSSSTESNYNPTQSRYIENQTNFENDDSFDFSVYYHKKIRAEQVRSKTNIFQRETLREDGLPKINHVFSKFNNVDKDYTQPLYMQVGDESERPFTYAVYMGKPNNTSILEGLYNFKNSFITNEPLLKVVTTSNTKCVYSTPLISTPIAQVSFGEQNHYTSHEMDSQPYYPDNERSNMPRLNDSLLEDHLRREFTNDMSDLSSSSDSLVQDPNVTIPEMVEDALELITQDGDYMERINMDVRMQCFLCNWAGPKIVLEYHVRKEHPIQTVCLNESWRVVFTPTSLRNVWTSRVLEKNDQLYVLSAKHEDNCLFATLTTISSMPPKSGSISFFNSLNLEHITWQGEIRELHSNMPYENHRDGLNLTLSDTNLFENNTVLNECFFTFFVKIFD